MISSILVGSGAALGAMIRFTLNNYFESRTKRLPKSTFFINLTGSFILGCLFGAKLSPEWFLFLGTGIMGGYTTFSTFNFELLILMKDDRPMFYRYFFLTYVVGLISSFCGILIGSFI
ncbi:MULTISPECIES: fluoride efflux transporter FluC [Enterococcus]|uniref:Fluoride-specific ion channel FluC n=1 Tax=Enterococcus alishanensis TaxID=1303817 RepID=A0ABS6TDZ9_9ENTE|nr:CrcB family protein [Enterococcus alishanensis]MBV7391156.1 CrcB family protein [Enterococcus alishanensis]